MAWFTYRDVSLAACRGETHLARIGKAAALIENGSRRGDQAVCTDINTTDRPVGPGRLSIRKREECANKKDAKLSLKRVLGALLDEHTHAVRTSLDPFRWVGSIPVNADMALCVTGRPDLRRGEILTMPTVIAVPIFV